MLNDMLIKSTKLMPKGQTKNIPDGGGLSIYITHTGKYWKLRYYLNGKQQVMSLGEYPIVSLLEARTKLFEVKKQIHNGQDPRIESKKVSEWTFSRVANLWLENWRHDKSEQHVGTTKRRLEVDVFPVIGQLPIDDITTQQIVLLVKNVASRGAVDVAKRVLQKIGQIYRYAIANSYATKTPVIINPSEILPATKTKNLARIDEKDLGELLQKIEVYQGNPTTRIAIKLMALTFVRTSELIEARWSEIDLDKARWNIPADRMKMCKL